MDKKWMAVGRAENFPEGLHMAGAANRTVVIACLGGDLYAFNPLCPHLAGPMERSEVQGAIIACPFHGWRFDLKDDGREIHNYGRLRTYPVKVDKGEVFIGF